MFNPDQWKACVYARSKIKVGLSLTIWQNNNQTTEISGFKVRVLLLTHIWPESARIPRAPVTFTVNVTTDKHGARPVGSNTREGRIKERSVVTLQRKREWMGGTVSQSLQITEQWVNRLRNLYVCFICFDAVVDNGGRRKEMRPKKHSNVMVLPLWSCSGGPVFACCWLRAIWQHFEGSRGSFLTALREAGKENTM